MKINIYLTNGKQWALDVGGTRINSYRTLKELFQYLGFILNLTVEKSDEDKSYKLKGEK